MAEALTEVLQAAENVSLREILHGQTKVLPRVLLLVAAMVVAMVVVVAMGAMVVVVAMVMVVAMVVVVMMMDSDGHR